jgi:signal transduction histidine kinase
MKVFQFKLTCWIALGFFCLMFVTIIAFNVYAVHGVVHEAKVRMKVVSRGILEELESYGSPPEGPIAPEVVRTIDANMGYIARERKIGYAIVSLDHEVLYQTPGFNISMDKAFLATPHKRPFIVRIEPEEELDDALSRWHFMYRYEGDDFIIFTNDRGEYELVEKLVEGLFLVLVLAILLALPSGYLVSRKILNPLDAIDSAVQKIRVGDLAARIARPDSEDEVSNLIDTLNLTFDELQASFNRIQRFSADAAHELNTPLTAIRGSMEVCLGRERAVDEYQTVLAESVEQITSLSRLVRDLLLLAKPGSQRQKDLFVPVDYSAVVDRAVEQAQAVGDTVAVRVLPDIEPGLILPGNESLLLRMCYNLIHNGIRFSCSGSTVTVGLQRQENSIILEVQDHGIGIHPEDREKIFEQFYQVDKSRNTGTGLGLSIVRWIVDLHDGRIDVESEPGCGALFRVVLPIHSSSA